MNVAAKKSDNAAMTSIEGYIRYGTEPAARTNGSYPFIEFETHDAPTAREGSFELYAQPALLERHADDKEFDVVGRIVSEARAAFTAQLDDKGPHTISNVRILRDPWSAKPYILFYVTATATPAPQVDVPRPRAVRALAWARDTFGDIAMSRRERALRFLEEAIELVHAEGIDLLLIPKAVARVYSREPGDATRKIGQACLALEILAENMGVSAADQAEAELEWEKRYGAKVKIGIAMASEVDDHAGADFIARRCERMTAEGWA